MFDMGLIELLLIFIVALLVIGPERLPQVARSAGKYVAKARRFVAGVKSDIERELHADELRQILKDQSEQIDDLKEVLDDTRKQLNTETSDIIDDVKTEVQEMTELAEPNPTKASDP